LFGVAAANFRPPKSKLTPRHIARVTRCGREASRHHHDCWQDDSCGLLPFRTTTSKAIGDGAIYSDCSNLVIQAEIAIFRNEMAGRPRRAQTFLRALGIDITFSREGRAGSRIIRIRVTQENTVSTVSSVCDQPAPRQAGDVCDGRPA